MSLVSQLFPRVRVMKMHYTSTRPYVLNGYTLVCPFAQELRINDIYDPLTNITGWDNVSATMYTLMASQYGRYVVLGSKAVFTIRQASQMNVQDMKASGIYTPNIAESLYSSLPTPTIRFGLILDNDRTYTGKSTYTDFIGSKFHKFKDVTMSHYLRTKCVLSIGYSPKKYFGLPSSDLDVGAAINASPAKICNATVYCQELSQSLNISTQYIVTAEIFYTVKFMDPKDYQLGQGR